MRRITKKGLNYAQNKRRYINDIIGFYSTGCSSFY